VKYRDMLLSGPKLKCIGQRREIALEYIVGRPRAERDDRAPADGEHDRLMKPVATGDVVHCRHRWPNLRNDSDYVRCWQVLSVALNGQKIRQQLHHLGGCILPGRVHGNDIGKAMNSCRNLSVGRHTLLHFK
jgi:hypothetical protein